MHITDIKPTFLTPEAYRVYSACMYKPTYEKFADEARELMSDDSATVLGCFEDGELLGIIALKDNGPHAEIEGIAVDTAYRKKGVGRALIDRALDVFGALFAETDDDAVGFYRSCGFACDGFTKAFPDGQCTRYNCTKRSKMRIIEYFSVGDVSWIPKIEVCDWSAARFLAKILRDGTFFDNLGEDAELYLKDDDGKLAAFATLSPRDCVDDDSLTPWIGFVFVSPEYRGRRISGQMIAHAEDIARKKGYDRTYICTNEIGLYEKYGYIYLETRPDIYGGQSRVYYKDLKVKA